MIQLAPLALRYAWYHRGRWAILTLTVGVALAVPLAGALALRSFSARLTRRAAETPIIVGAAGGRQDLLLATLELHGTELPTLARGQWLEMGKATEGGGAEAIPLHLKHTIQGRPLVGTTPAYFPQHGLRLADGAWWSHLGEVVAGAEAARKLGLKPGSVVLTDSSAWLNLHKALPLRLRVAGVLAPGGSADDDALFCDIPLCWIADGLGHGHAEPDAAHAQGSVVKTFTEVTPENEKSFHFHGDQAAYPLSAVVLVPRSQAAHTILLTRYRSDRPGLQALEGPAAADELLAQVRRAKRVLDAAAGAFALAAALMVGLLVMLCWRERAGDREHLQRMGCGRLATAALVSCDLWSALLGGSLLAAGLSLVAWLAAARWL